MFDVNDDAKSNYRRVEMLTGPGRRRRWSLEAKARVVVESFAPGAGVSEVARRWQVCPQQVFAWRREARAGLLTLPSEAAAGTAPAPDFVPILAEPALPSVQPASAPAKASVSTIDVERDCRKIGGQAARLRSGSGVLACRGVTGGSDELLM